MGKGRPDPGLVAVGRGDAPADVLLRGASVFVPWTKEWVQTDLAVANGRIAGWGPRDALEEVDLDGAALVAGFIDAHMHIESTKLWVDQFVRVVLPRGTTTVAADPHEIANVFGEAGILALVEAASSLPFTLALCASSCVPASPLESSGATLSAKEVEGLLGSPAAVAVAEMMNYPGVIAGEDEVLAKIAAAGRLKVDGHAPGLSGRLLDAYLAAGVQSDHECIELTEAEEKRRKGMWVFLREGSASRNLATLAPMVLSGGTSNLALCTDDREPSLLQSAGHVNDCIRVAVANGVSIEDALVMATANPASYFGLEHLGSLSPGCQADICCFDNLGSLEPAAVWQRGKLVASGGRMKDAPLPAAVAPQWMRDSVRLAHVPSPADFDHGMADGTEVAVIGVVPQSIRTTRERAVLGPEAGDLARLAVMERHRGSGRVGLGFVSGFGLGQGAIASTVAHDAHNLMVVGALGPDGPSDMAVAAGRLAEIGGGQVVVVGGEILAELELAIGGLMSDRPAAEVAEAEVAVVQAAARLGVRLAAPFMQLSFLGLSVIPDLKLTDLGMVDVGRFEIVPVAQ